MQCKWDSEMVYVEYLRWNQLGYWQFPIDSVRLYTQILPKLLPLSRICTHGHRSILFSISKRPMDLDWSVHFFGYAKLSHWGHKYRIPEGQKSGCCICRRFAQWGRWKWLHSGARHVEDQMALEQCLSWHGRQTTRATLPTGRLDKDFTVQNTGSFVTHWCTLLQ